MTGESIYTGSHYHLRHRYCRKLIFKYRYRYYNREIFGTGTGTLATAFKTAISAAWPFESLYHEFLLYGNSSFNVSCIIIELPRTRSLFVFSVAPFFIMYSQLQIITLPDKIIIHGNLLNRCSTWNTSGNSALFSLHWQQWRKAFCADLPHPHDYVFPPPTPYLKSNSN